MKKFGILLLLIIAVLIIAVFRQQYIYSANGRDSLLDKFELLEPEKKPLEIEPVILDFDSILTSEIQASGTVGAAVVVTYKDQVAFLKCYGVKKVGENDSIDEHTIFRLASVSKTLSGTLAGILAEKNEINLDDKVVTYLPDFRLTNSENTKNLAIRHLLSHTSGLVAHSYDNFVEQKVPMQKIIPSLNQVSITAAPGQKYDYQNVMFSLLDTILANKLHKPFNSLIHDNLFSPFGMNDASTGFGPFESNPNKAWPHSGANGNFRPIKLNDRYYTTAPAAGINASITDMGQFLLHLTADNRSSVKPEVKNIIFAPQVVSPLSHSYLSYWDKVDSKEYALGWRIIGYKGRTVAYHGGYVNGYKTEIAYCADEEIGIAFLTNSPNPVASMSVPTLLNLLFKFNDDKKTLTNSENLPTSKVNQ